MITIANHPTAVTNCRVAETIEKRHNLLSHGEMLENVRPRSIMENTCRGRWVIHHDAGGTQHNHIAFLHLVAARVSCASRKSR